MKACLVLDTCFRSACPIYFQQLFRISSFTGFWLVCCQRSSLMKNHSKQAMIYDLISHNTEHAQPLTTFTQFTTFWKLIINLSEMLYYSLFFKTHKTPKFALFMGACAQQKHTLKNVKTHPEIFTNFFFKHLIISFNK